MWPKGNHSIAIPYNRVHAIAAGRALGLAHIYVHQCFRGFATNGGNAGGRRAVPIN